MNGLIAAAALATGLVSLVWAEPAPPRFELQAEIRDGDTIAARPRLVAAIGEPATIHIVNEDYSLRITATPDASAQVKVDSLVTSWTRSGLIHQDNHTKLRADGTPAALRFSRIEPDSGATSELTIHLKVTPVAQ